MTKTDDRPERRRGPDRRRSNRALRRVVVLVVTAYFLMLGMFLLLWQNSRDAADAKTRSAVAFATATAEKEARLAEKRAEITGRYQACVRSIPTLLKVNAFVDAQKGLARDVLQNAVASHAATPKGTALWRAQERNIDRLRERYRATARVTFPTPTMNECRDRRRSDLAELRDPSPGRNPGPG